MLYVSDGPTPSVLPPMVGMPVDQVMATLAPLDLKLVVSGQQFSETAPVNTVVAFTVAGQAVPEGAAVDKGSTVNVIVSAGPEPRTIPQLTGLPPDQVEQTLKGLGLVPARGEDVFDPVVAAGLVAASTPPQGTQVARDSTVTYQVSKGADLVTVPNLYLMTLPQATAALNAAGLTVGPIVGRSQPGRRRLGAAVRQPGPTRLGRRPDLLLSRPRPPTAGRRPLAHLGRARGPE